MTTRLLIAGASGFIGWNLMREGVASYRLTGICHRHPVVFPHGESMQCDLTDPVAVARCIERVKPDHVVNLAALSQPNFCEEHPEASRRINVDAAAGLATMCGKKGIGYLFASSAQVFGGDRAPYREEDPTTPINGYGRQKARAERAIMERCPHAVICRLPLMYGDPGPAAQSFIQPWIASLGRNEPLNLFTDEIRTPLFGRDAALGILLALDRCEGEILHLGGPHAVSRFYIGELLVRFLGCDRSLIVPRRQKDVGMAAPRPRDVSLTIDKARSLGFSPCPIEEALPRLLSRGFTSGG